MSAAWQMLRVTLVARGRKTVEVSCVRRAEGQANHCPSNLAMDEAQSRSHGEFPLDDLGADSLDIVELVMAFEEAFDLDIPDEDAEKIATVKNAVDYIESKKK